MNSITDKPSNLQNLQKQQIEFCAHIRDPEGVSMPEKLEARRVKIYQELVFNNIESMLASTVPITVELLPKKMWLNLVRGFIKDHRAKTPYFSQLGNAFLEYLSTADQAESSQSQENILTDYPDFLLELIHYEQMELTIFMQELSEEEATLFPTEKSASISLNEQSSLHVGDISWQVSPLLELLAYGYPVHQISPSNQPDTLPDQPTCLFVYQDAEGEVRFLETQPLGFQLIQFLKENPKSSARQFFKTLLCPEEQQNTLLLQCIPLLQELNDLNLLALTHVNLSEKQND